MAGIKGSLIGLKIDGVYVACETSSEFNFEVDMLSASAPDSGRWKSFVAGIRSWSITVSAQLLLSAAGADISTVLNAVLTGAEVDLEFRSKSTVTTSFSISGKALPKTGNIGAGVVGKGSWTVTFQGTGPFTTNFVLEQ